MYIFCNSGMRKFGLTLMSASTSTYVNHVFTVHHVFYFYEACGQHRAARQKCCVPRNGAWHERSKNMKKKSKESTKEVTRKIKKLYRRLVDYYKLSVSDAIEIGKLLSLQKKELKHGEWIPWVEEILPFSKRSARNYISLYKNRAKLKKARVADLNSAYKVLANYYNQDRDKKRSKTRASRKAFADKPSNFTNPQGNYINQALVGDNYKTMQKMLKHGMAGKYTAVNTSPGYNADFYYGEDYDDGKPYEDYLNDILKPFPLYTKLLRPGGRVMYVIGSVAKNRERDDHGDYNHQIVTDLINGVKEVAPDESLGVTVMLQWIGRYKVGFQPPATVIHVKD